MAKDLTTSPIDRQNILNNPFAIKELQKATGVRGILFEDKVVLLKEQVATFFGVTTRTIENYLEKDGDELRRNGYEVIRGKRLKDFRAAAEEAPSSVPDFDRKTPQLGIFDFRAFLNLAMLMSESDAARSLRKAILDVAIDSIHLKVGGATKYINQRDEGFLQAAFAGENYRRQFTDALRDFVDMGNFKYALYTDRVYLCIFRENAREYKSILKLGSKDNLRATLYSEVLMLIASFENGVTDALKTKALELGRKLTSEEVDEIFQMVERMPVLKPIIEDARRKMASRDYTFRDALHQHLTEYLQPLQREEFERFLGEKSMELTEQLEEAKEVMKRLRER